VIFGCVPGGSLAENRLAEKAGMIVKNGDRFVLLGSLAGMYVSNWAKRIGICAKLAGEKGIVWNGSAKPALHLT
jgi:hypothetical protein